MPLTVTRRERTILAILLILISLGFLGMAVF